MMIDRMKKCGCLLLCVLLLLTVLPLQVFAAGIIELSKDVTLTISYKDGSTALSGARFLIYRVADVDAYAYSEFTLTDEFEESSVSVNNLDSSGWRTAANTLASYVQLKNIAPLESGSTDSEGLLTFKSEQDSMNPGLYLVVGQKHTQNRKNYTAEPFLVSLPVLNEIANAWIYDGTASPKFTSKPVTPIIPDRTIERKVIKVWDDEDFEHKRPDQVTAVLLRDGSPYDSVVLNRGNNWTHRWNKLDPNYTWTITEESVPKGYKVAIRQEGITTVITNTYRPEIETTDKQVIKIWDDDGNTEHRPSNIFVELCADDHVYDTISLNERNNWQYRWNDLEASVIWSVREKNVPDGYTSSVMQSGDTFVITNTFEDTVETVTKQVIKIWEDDGYIDKRPTEIEIELLADGVTYDTVVLNAENNWMYRWNELNKDIEWSVREIAVNGNYESSVKENGSVFVVTNTFIEPQTPVVPMNRSVLKVWKDEGHTEERPTSVLAALFCDGELYEIVTLNADNGWMYHWIDLDGTKDWTLIEYTMLDKYTSRVVQDGDMFVITNTYSVIPQTGQLWWPVPMLLAIGLTMIIGGLIRRRGMER